MIVNVENFKTLLKKATVNYSIESVQLNFDEGLVESRLINNASNVISILKLKNDVIPELKGPTEFKFSDPAQDLLPYLALMDEETVIKIDASKISLLAGKKVSAIHFCVPEVIRIFSKDASMPSLSPFYTMDVDNDLSIEFENIKKIGSRFGKVYFGVEKGKFYIETSDKINPYSNSLRIDIGTVKFNDMSMCFDYKYIINLMSVIDGLKFNIDFYWIKDKKLGLMKAINKDNSETYYLMSHSE